MRGGLGVALQPPPNALYGWLMVGSLVSTILGFLLNLVRRPRSPQVPTFVAPGVERVRGSGGRLLRTLVILAAIVVIVAFLVQRARSFTSPPPAHPPGPIRLVKAPPAPCRQDHLAAWQHGFVAFGTDHTAGRLHNVGVLCMTEDGGKTWVTRRIGGGDDVVIRDIAVYADTICVVGTVGIFTNRPTIYYDGAAWRFSDPVRWTRSPDPKKALGGPKDQDVRRLRIRNGHLEAYGTSGRLGEKIRDVMWTSTDCLIWTIAS
jgi:hypothetical protein